MKGDYDYKTTQTKKGGFLTKIVKKKGSLLVPSTRALSLETTTFRSQIHNATDSMVMIVMKRSKNLMCFPPETLLHVRHELAHLKDSPHVRLHPRLRTSVRFLKNIATGETSPAITPYHFFGNFNFFSFHLKITFITR